MRLIDPILLKFRAWYSDTQVEADASEVQARSPHGAAEVFVELGPRGVRDGDETMVGVKAEDGTVTFWSVESTCDWLFTASPED